MNFFSPKELTENYSAAGANKTKLSAGKVFFLGILAGFAIALAGASASTATHNLDTAGMVRLVSSVLFPFGLCTVVLLGGELFTGNSLIVISVLDKKASLGAMLKNWLVAYLGNFVGALMVAAGCVFSGQLNYSASGLAVTTIKIAVSKCSLMFGPALILGILCNALVCIAVLQAFSAKDTAGKILGIFMPICFFIVCGFEHSVANMFYIPAGLLAITKDVYRDAAAAAGVNTEMLTWGNYLVKNLLPVTIGNIIGGAAVALLMWYANLRGKNKAA